MTTWDLAEILGYKHLGKPKSFKGFSVDSRNLQEGQLFVALKGKTHDGHDFVLDALGKGAAGVLCERELQLPTDFPQVVADSTLKALRGFALWKRKNYKGKVIAIAGSAGKTTTKELTSFLLSKVGKVCKTPKNYNSQVGVPLSIANFDEDCHFWVVEMGASQRGDVKSLVEVVEPHVRAITTIGEEHLETFGCLQDVVLGNGEVFHQMRQEDWGVCPANIAHCYQIPRKIIFGDGSLKAERIHISEEGVSFWLDGLKIFLPTPSLALVENVLCAFAILLALGFDWRDFYHHLEHFHPVEGRFRLVRRGNLTIIDDTYNANPPSMRMALKSLSLFKALKIAVLGDMLELGKDSDKYHREVGQLCVSLNIDLCLFFGKAMRHAYQTCKELGGNCLSFEEHKSLLQWLLENVHQKAVILFKGSRGMSMERLVEGMLNGRLG